MTSQSAEISARFAAKGEKWTSSTITIQKNGRKGVELILHDKNTGEFTARVLLRCGAVYAVADQIVDRREEKA